MLNDETLVNLSSFVLLFFLSWAASIAADAGSLFGLIVFAWTGAAFMLITLFLTSTRLWVVAIAVYCGASLVPSLI